MSTAGKKLERERRTISTMIGLFCRDHHAPNGGLCPECEALAAYARQRLGNCPYGENKPTCAQCPIHCYMPARREQVKAVMRYAGPRMLLHQPILAIRHMLDERKRAPEPPRRRREEPSARGGAGRR